jgi:hypothetical protein
MTISAEEKPVIERLREVRAGSPSSVTGAQSIESLLATQIELV